jgi:hypothetical protein
MAREAIVGIAVVGPDEAWITGASGTLWHWLGSGWTWSMEG